MGNTWAAECRAEALRVSRTGLRISAPPAPEKAPREAPSRVLLGNLQSFGKGR